jgi:metallo-beta-lactamase family protein
MKLHFLGAISSVTGSKYVIEMKTGKLLIECGLFQGRRSEFYQRNRQFPFDPSEIDAMILTHAHIDHSGNIPNLSSRGFHGPIYSTPATRDLVSIMLRDSAKIQKYDIEEIRRRYMDYHKEGPLEPLYTEKMVVHSLRQFVSHNYHKKFEPIEGVSCTFHDAGHVLGSAILDLELRENGRKVDLTFTGDLGRKISPSSGTPRCRRGRTT